MTRIDPAALREALEYHDWAPAGRGERLNLIFAAARAYLDGEGVPEGWQLVPVIAPSEMIWDAMTMAESLAIRDDADMRAMWAAFLKAAPKPPILDGEAWQQIETAPKDGAEAATKEVEVWRLEMARWDKGTLPEWSAEIINFGSEGAAHECARNLRSGSTHNREWTRFDCIRVTGPHKQTVPA